MDTPSGESERAERSLFREEQRFRQAGLCAVLLLSPLIGVFVAVVQSWPPPSERGPVVAVLALVLGIGVPLLFYWIKLTTEVDPAYLRIRFFPSLARRSR